MRRMWGASGPLFVRQRRGAFRFDRRARMRAEGGAVRSATTVDVWRSYHCRTDWSVSTCDDEGEIRCIGGGEEEESWDIAREAADDLGIPARLIRSESGEVVRTYVPSAVLAEEAEERQDVQERHGGEGDAG